MSREDHTQGPAINDITSERGEECKKIKIWDDFQVKYITRIGGQKMKIKATS